MQNSPQQKRVFEKYHCLFFLSFCIFWFFSCFERTFAQQDGKYEVSGELLSVEDGEEEPLPLTNIVVDSLQIGTASNMDGEFSIFLPPGKHKLSVRSIGYKPQTIEVIVIDKPVKNVIIKVENIGFQLEEIVIRPGENPALRIIRNAIKNKNENRINNLEYYSYEAYNKTNVTLTNLSKEKIEKNVLLRPTRKFIREHAQDTALIDTNKKYKIGVFVSESISDIYYKKPTQKEVIKARQATGQSNSETNLVTSLLANVDIYDNYITILEKEFLSPLATGAMMNYNYLLVDTIIVAPGDSIFGIDAIPKRKFDKVFKGRLYIESTNWAVKQVDLRMNTDPNINFVKNVRIRQEFNKIKGNWMPTLKDIQVDFKNDLGEMGLTGRTATFMRSYNLDQPPSEEIMKGSLVVMDTNAFNRDSTFWNSSRHSKLEQSDQLAYEFIDQLRKQSIYQVILTVNEMLTTGKKRIGKIDVGPYSKLTGFNPVEGLRLQFGVYSNEIFDRRLSFGGHAAYGFKDQTWKYALECSYKFTLAPKLQLYAARYSEVDQAGFQNYIYDGRGLLNSVLIRVPLRKLNYYQQNKIGVFAEITNGVMGNIFFQDYAFEPGFAYYYLKDNNLFSHFKTAEIGANMRFSYRESYVLRRDERIYTGTKFPILYIDYRMGLKNFLGGQFNYHKVAFTLSNKLKLGRFGWSNYTATAGQIFGTLPYASLYVFQGSQSYALDPMGYYLNALSSYIGSVNLSSNYDRVSFNLMYFYEFAADRYLVAGIDHHFEGYVFNKLLGIRWVLHKLKLKEVFTMRYGIGEMTQENVYMNSPQTIESFLNRPEIQNNLDDLIRVKTPYRPYVEIGAGVENIFKFFRVDFIWRLTHQNPVPPKELAKYDYNFGIRIYSGISF